MSKARDGVIPRSKLTAHMPPGAGKPRSGAGEVARQQAGGTKDVAGSVLSDRPKEGWTLVGPGYGYRKGK